MSLVGLFVAVAESISAERAQVVVACWLRQRRLSRQLDVGNKFLTATSLCPRATDIARAANARNDREGAWASSLASERRLCLRRLDEGWSLPQLPLDAVPTDLFLAVCVFTSCLGSCPAAACSDPSRSHAAAATPRVAQ
jgi:hypothetical protein